MSFLRRIPMLREFAQSMRSRIDPAQEIAIAHGIEAGVAANVPIDRRGPVLGNAVAHYLAAASASVPGSALWIEGTFQAGCLLAGENSIRDLSQAIGLLESVIARISGYHLAYYYLAEAYVMMKDFDRAEALLRTALELDPGQDGLRVVLRNIPIDRVHDAEKRGDRAGVIETVRRIDPAARTAESWVLLGDALAETGDIAAADAWRHAMLLEPLKGMRRRFRSLSVPFPGDEMNE